MDFSVVVPTYQRPSSLASLLEALQAQKFPRSQFEVIVVNDGGGDLEPVVARFRNSLSIELLRCDHVGCAAARQGGVLKARGRLLAFTDDDCLPAPDWLQRLYEASDIHPGAALGGSVVNGSTESLVAEASQRTVNYFTAYQNRGPAGPRYFPTNNLVLPAEAFRRIGGLDVNWRIAGGEDRDLCQRWISAGYRIAAVPSAVVKHRPRLTLRSFLRQHFHYGRGACCFRRKVRAASLGAASLERPGFYAALPFAASSGLPAGRAVHMGSLLVASQVATVAGYVWESLRGRGRAPTPGVSRETLEGIEVRT